MAPAFTTNLTLSARRLLTRPWRTTAICERGYLSMRAIPNLTGSNSHPHRSDAFDGARSIAVEHGELGRIERRRPQRSEAATCAARKCDSTMMGKRQAIRTTGSDSHRRTSSVPRPTARLWGCRTDPAKSAAPTNAISDPEASSTQRETVGCSDAAGQPPARRTGPEHLGSGQLGGPPG